MLELKQLTYLFLPPTNHQPPTTNPPTNQQVCVRPPTVGPTVRPTSAPTMSAEPTLLPTMAPTTSLPTTAPTTTPIPSSPPTPEPTPLCGPGKFLNTSSHECEGCASGRVSEGGVGVTSCGKCPLGEFPTSDQSECRVCGAGMETNSDGTSCEECKSGKYSDGVRVKFCWECAVSHI